MKDDQKRKHLHQIKDEEAARKRRNEADREKKRRKKRREGFNFDPFSW